MEKNLRPYVSIVIPIHDMEGGDAFLWRTINALMDQTFQDFEIIITKQGKMAENTNAGIKRARGEFIKIIYLDDYLSTNTSLEQMVASCQTWLICGANNNLYPRYTDNLEMGNNKLGSPSALMFRNDDPFLFDENMSWLLDCDYYKRLYERYGPPEILLGNHITIGEGPHQMTHRLTDDDKLDEEEYLQEKYAQVT